MSNETGLTLPALTWFNETPMDADIVTVRANTEGMAIVVNDSYRVTDVETRFTMAELNLIYKFAHEESQRQDAEEADDSDTEEDDWRKYDHQDHEANAAYYDEVAQEQGCAEPDPEKPEPPETQHLKLARQHIDEYERRINDDRIRFSDITDRQIYEDRAYKQAMMHAAYAQAEAAARQAEAAECFLEFVAEFVDKTDLADVLIRWGHHQ